MLFWILVDMMSDLCVVSTDYYNGEGFSSRYTTDDDEIDNSQNGRFVFTQRQTEQRLTR